MELIVKGNFSGIEKRVFVITDKNNTYRDINIIYPRWTWINVEDTSDVIYLEMQDKYEIIEFIHCNEIFKCDACLIEDGNDYYDCSCDYDECDGGYDSFDFKVEQIKKKKNKRYREFYIG